MAYIKTEWENLPSTKTPINANNLNKIENGIYMNSVNIGELTDLTTTNKNSVVGAINELNSQTIYTVLYTGDTATNTLTLSQSIFDFSIVIVKIKNASTLLIGAVDRYKNSKIFRPTAMQFGNNEIYICGLASHILDDGKTLTIENGCMYYYGLISGAKVTLDTVEYVIGVI